jgi:hypothetical protein
MRMSRLIVVTVVWSLSSIMVGRAQTGARLHEIDGFIAKGVFSELDPELMKHRLTFQELKDARLNGETTDIDEILAWMAKCEKMGSHVEEPLEVRGRMAVSLPPNTLGDEAFTTCFYAFSCNGLGFSGVAADLVLVRPEKHPRVERIGRPWNPDRILPTRLFRLGYLNPEAILRFYRDRAGTAEGHAVIERRSNALVVTDTAKSLETLAAHIDSQILHAMGVPAADGILRGEGPRPPSLGAIVSREAVHFYLLAYARSNRFPLAGKAEKNVLTKYYPEADLWTNPRSHDALSAEYERISEYVRLARDTGGQAWDDADPTGTLSPGEQKNLAIRYGVALPTPVKGSAPKNKRAARKR